MIATYEMTVNCMDPTMAEAAVKEMDRIVRWYYNVYGGRRVWSGKIENGEYLIKMHYRANWWDSRLVYWPVWHDIVQTFYRRLNKVDPDDTTEIHTRQVA